MPEYNHIFLNDIAQSERFTSTSSFPSEPNIPQRDRASHSQQLIAKFNAINGANKSLTEQRDALSLPTRTGTYVEFSSGLNAELITKSLEDRSKEIRLLNIRTEPLENGEITKAIVYIPKGKESFFINKVKDYSTKNTQKGNPKNAPLVNSIEDVKLAMLESFWPIEERRLIPDTTPSWCEAWVRINEDSNYDSQIRIFIETLERLEISMKGQTLHFPERSVFLINANREQLTELFMYNSP